MEIAQSKYCTQSGFISQLTGLDSGSQSLLGSGLFHLGCIPDSKAQDSRFHKQKYMGRTYFTGIYFFLWYRSESYHIRHARGVKKLHSPFWADWGRFPFDKHSDLKFRKIYVTNATVHSGRTYPTQATPRLVIALVSRIQKSGTGDNNFVKWKGTFRSDRPTEVTWPVKEDHLEGWSQIFRSDRIEIVCSIWFLTEISGILGWAPWGSRGMHSFPRKMIKFWVLGNAVWSVAAGNSKCFVLRFKRGFRSSTLTKQPTFGDAITGFPPPPPNDVWEKSAEIPHWRRVTTRIWVALLIGSASAVHNF